MVDYQVRDVSGRHARTNDRCGGAVVNIHMNDTQTTVILDENSPLIILCWQPYWEHSYLIVISPQFGKISLHRSCVEFTDDVMPSDIEIVNRESS